MNIFKATKTNALFLATIIFAGIIAISSTSFMKDVQAQPYYDTKYNSYEPLQYPSDNNNYKSKDSKSININKIKCINNNLNINDNNTGDVNIGNKEQGYLGDYSSADVGYGGERYDDGYYKKGFDCIINNNNNNTVVVEEEPPIPLEDECVLCLNANATFAEIITESLEIPGPTRIASSLFEFIIGEDVTTIPELCNLLREEILAGNIDQSEQHLSEIFFVLEAISPDSPDNVPRFSESVEVLVECLLDVDFG